MKCQKCDKPATFHITELTEGKPQELHLCEEHAREYLTQSGDEPTRGGQHGGGAGAADGRRPNGRGTGPSSTSRSAPCAGSASTISAARAGWAARTTTSASRPQLEPLILNIHGETRARRQDAQTGLRRQHRPNPTDPASSRNEGSHRRRGLRAGERTARRNPPYREQPETGDSSSRLPRGEEALRRRTLATESQGAPLELNDLTRNPGEWLRGSGPESDIVISSRDPPGAEPGRLPVRRPGVGGRSHADRDHAPRARAPSLAGRQRVALPRRRTTCPASIASSSSNATSSAANTPRARAPAPSPSTATRSSAS